MPVKTCFCGLAVTGRFNGVRDLEYNGFSAEFRNDCREIPEHNVRVLFRNIISFAALAAEQDRQKAGYGVCHILVGIILRTCGLQYNILAGNTFFNKLTERLCVAHLHRRAIGTGKAGDYNIQLFLRFICLAERLAAALALRIAGPQGVRVDVTAVFFVKKLDISAVLPVNLIGGGKGKARGVMRNGKIQHVLQADDVSRDGTDRVCRILHGMGVGGKVQNNIHRSDILTNEGLFNVIGNKNQMRIVFEF